MKKFQNTNIKTNTMTMESIRYLLIFSITFYEIFRSCIIPNPILKTTIMKTNTSMPIKSPFKFADESMARNIEFLNVRMTCSYFINKTDDKNNTLIYNIKSTMLKTEYLLVGIIDLIEIKMKMDKYIIKQIENNKCKSINLDEPDKEAYMTLEQLFNETMDNIDSYIKQLRTQCNFKLHQKIQSKIMQSIAKPVIINKSENSKPLKTDNIASKINSFIQDIEMFGKDDYLMPNEDDELPLEL